MFMHRVGPTPKISNHRAGYIQALKQVVHNIVVHIFYNLIRIINLRIKLVLLDGLT